MPADESRGSAEALWYVGPGRVEIRREPLGEPGPGEIQVRALYSAISRGTERLVLAGRVPESEFERMRAPFMGGAFPFPVKYGYATVGRVERGPPEWLDRLVFALHPHQTLFNLPAEVDRAAARRPRASPRRPRGQYGDRAQRGVGRGAGGGRQYRGGGRGSGRLAGRLSVRGRFPARE